MRKLTYYIALTIDGFIAAPDGSADFYPLGEDLLAHIASEYPETLPTHARKALGVDSENKHFDTIVMGRATYDPALREGITSPYQHLRQYVVSRSLAASPDPAVHIVSGDPVAMVRELKEEDGLGIYLAGGGQLAGALLPEIDELIVKIYPVVAGSGTPMFSAEFSPLQFELTAGRLFESGAAIMTYARK
ncbi:dihydrofolate reductase family protein [Streptomyces sp. NPDC004647]|uniref:dihydrofolate reductase family protein n=1 Tax=Streptomyces sp. NPDC004647 TaxID=3154671 RepID=UPI0033AA39CC